ncbi:MAG TPA: preprotein translocase subunit SecY [Chloroflexi bacterium]|nr:preprotein translocase subunit SecY [Chloroflexota bacterium]HBY07948.1 preprotein translocase subunit SecY [Chloroflexota bacterium]
MKRSAWRYLWTARDIRRKLLITLGILVIYRLAAHVPVPGANRAAIAALMGGGSAQSTLLSIMDMLSGGTVSNFSVLAMGVYPYITAQIILQLLVPVVPQLQARMEEDPREGQKWMEKWTYILAVPMAALQAIGQIRIFGSFAGQPIIDNFGFGSLSMALSSFAIVASMTAGTMFAIWLGELISEFGIRNQGLSLLIFAGIVSNIPRNFAQMLNPQAFPDNPAKRWWVLVALIVITILIIFAIVYVQQGQRNVPVMYPGRRVGNRMSMPVKGTLPLRVNMAGMIPIIFAQSLLTFPAIIAGFFVSSQIAWVANLATGFTSVFGGGSNWYWIMYFLMVVGFTFFYTDVLFAQQNYGENLKRSGARIPGVTPGPPTQRYLTKVLRRITLPGAVFLGFVAITPFIIGLALGLGSNTNVLLVSSSGLLIVVGVVRDVFYNINAELKLHGYDDSLLVR